VLKEKAGLDVVAMYPARPEHTPESDQWTWDTFLSAAEACQKANVTFGIGVGQTPDSVDTAGCLFRGYGAALIDREGNVQVDSDKVRQVLEYGQKLVKVLPADAASYDDATDNRVLIAGKSALIFNSPSAWTVAKRDAPQVAEDCWTFPTPAGPEGRFKPHDTNRPDR
jgi:ABC-type glycerol-3-phosphate transport system substrate-binding protein